MSMFQGSLTALVTPFRNGEVDWAALENLIEWQIQEGTHGLVVCGTTAESPTLSHEEHRKIFDRAIDVVKRRIPVIAGTGSNCTKTAVDTTEYARQCGMDAAMVVTPYYNKPSQDGMFAHFREIATSVNIPIIIYNIPGRCIVDLETATLSRLSQFSNIIGIKDATGNPDRVEETKYAMGPGFTQFCGEDALTLDYLQRGAHGCISVTSNAAPGLCAQLHNAWRANDNEKARHLHKRLMPMHKALFCEPSPQPVKYALLRLGMCSDEVRLPLIRASHDCRLKVDDAMAQTGLIIKDEHKAQGA